MWRRERGCCRRCGLPCKLQSDSLFDLLHVHEIQFRSDGGDPTDPANCVGLCYRCHLAGLHRQTSNRSVWFVIVVLDRERGANNPDGLRFDPFVTKEEQWRSDLETTRHDQEVT